MHKPFIMFCPLALVADANAHAVSLVGAEGEGTFGGRMLHATSPAQPSSEATHDGCRWNLPDETISAWEQFRDENAGFLMFDGSQVSLPQARESAGLYPCEDEG